MKDGSAAKEAVIIVFIHENNLWPAFC